MHRNGSVALIMVMDVLVDIVAFSVMYRGIIWQVYYSIITPEWLIECFRLLHM